MAQPRRQPRRAFSLIELLIAVVIIAICASYLLLAGPGKVARRLEVAHGVKEIAQMQQAHASAADIWAYTIDHCRRLVRVCREDPLFGSVANPDGSHADLDVLRMEELLDLRDEALAADPPQPVTALDAEIAGLRGTLEERYVRFKPSY